MEINIDIITGDRFAAIGARRIDVNNIYVDVSTLVHDNMIITHNGDMPVVGRHRAQAGHELAAWHGVNMRVFDDERFRPLPLGMENDYVPNALEKRYEVLRRPPRHVKNLLYVNFNTGTHADRKGLYNLYDWALRTECRSDNLKQHYEDVRQSHFVLSPPGNGDDCHRTWETLYMGKIPIVKNIYHPELFRGLPVLVVDEWTDVTKELLEEKLETMSKTSHDMDRLRFSYWKSKIENNE